MVQGRGSVKIFTVGMLLLCVLIQSALVVEGATYVVGDSMGWGFQTDPIRWVAGKNFKAGDTLVFNYWRPFHDVVVVDASGYNSCAARNSRHYSSGNDRLTLKKGANYFICSIPGHCSLAGMKLVVTAT